MLSRKGAGHMGIIVGILAVLFFAVLLYTTVSSDDGSNKTVEDARYELLYASPGHLVAANSTLAWTKYMNFSASIDGVPMNLSTELASIVSVEQKAYSGNKFMKEYEAANNSVGATLFFNLLAKDGDGTLKVYVNGKKVYSQDPSEGSKIKIELTSDQLKPAEVNVFEFKASTPSLGWLAFWKQNSYRLEGVFLDDRIFDEEGASAEITFSLDGDQVIGLTSAHLVADVTKLDGAESKKIFIDFGEETVYNNTPGAVGGAIDLDVPLSGFVSGTNSLTLSTELDGAYSIDLGLTMKILNLTSENYEVYIKNVADNVWPFVEAGQAGDDYECELFVKKASGADTVVVWINGHREVLAFDINDEIKQNVCGFLNKGSNTIRLIAEAGDVSDEPFIEVSKITLVVKDK